LGYRRADDGGFASFFVVKDAASDFDEVWAFFEPTWYLHPTLQLFSVLPRFLVVVQGCWLASKRSYL
jgi:hypothetical protein